MKKSYLNEITSKIPLSEAEQLPKDILDAEGIFEICKNFYFDNCHETGMFGNFFNRKITDSH